MIDNEFIRLDGRKTTDLRDLEIEVGLLDRADGSAQVKLGKNIVLAAVNGPMELHPKHSSMSQKAVVRVTYRMMPFSVEYRKNPYPSRREKEISKVLSDAFESVVITKMFPRAAIDVHVQMIQADGGSRTAASIAVSSALADAGIPMRALIGGIASGLYEDRCCLDLSGIEDNVGSGDMPILYSPELDEVSLFQLDGRFTMEQFKTCFNMSVDAISFIVDKQKEALREKYLSVKERVHPTKQEEPQMQEEHVEEPAEEPVEKPVEEIVAEKPAEVRTSRYQPPKDVVSPSVEVPEEVTPVEETPTETIVEETATLENEIITEPEYVPEPAEEPEPSFIEEDIVIVPIAEPSDEEELLVAANEVPVENTDTAAIAEEISNRYSLDVSLESDDTEEDEEAKRIAEKIQRDLEIQDFELGDDE